VLFYIGPEFLENLLSRNNNESVEDTYKEALSDESVQRELRPVSPKNHSRNSSELRRPQQHRFIMQWSFRWIFAGRDEPNYK
jgi:hypothetical protein